MASIYQITWAWTGGIGGTGYTNFFFRDDTPTPAEALTAMTNSRLFWVSAATKMPSTVTVSPVTDVRVLNDGTGDLEDIYTVTGITPVVGAIADRYASPVGGVVEWITTTIHGTRRMRGRTFVVPLSTLAFAGDGTLDSTTVTALATGAENMRTASGPTFGVWGRPRPEQDPPDPDKPAIPGLWGAAVSSRVPDRAAVLKSRRD